MQVLISIKLVINTIFVFMLGLNCLVKLLKISARLPGWWDSFTTPNCVTTIDPGNKPSLHSCCKMKWLFHFNGLRFPSKLWVEMSSITVPSSVPKNRGFFPSQTLVCGKVGLGIANFFFRSGVPRFVRQRHEHTHTHTFTHAKSLSLNIFSQKEVLRVDEASRLNFINILQAAFTQVVLSQFYWRTE